MKNFSAKKLSLLFAKHNVDLQRSTVVVALSGGLDSVVLLHAALQITKNIRCIHIHHGLQDQADDWVIFCRELCASVNCNLEFRKIKVPATGNIEEEARRGRYDMLRSMLDAEDILVTAHHLDDQIETFFLQLLRGSGLTGLQGMASQPRKFGEGLHFRPLLEFSRMQLENYAAENSLNWIDDPSNLDHGFDRNYLRHAVMPLLMQRWPGVRQSVSRSMQLFGNAETLLEELAQQDAEISGQGQKLLLEPLITKGELRLANAIRYWVRCTGRRPPNHERLMEGVRQFITADSDRNPILSWPDGRIQRYRGALYLDYQVSEETFAGGLPLTANTWTVLPERRGRVQLTAGQGPGIRRDLVEPGELEIRFRQSGERIQLPSGHHQRLKHWFQENDIAPLYRAWIPLIYRDSDLVAIGDRWITHEIKASADEDAWQIHWQKPQSII